MNDRILFVGNRRFVLESILKEKIPLAGIGVIKNTHLENDLSSNKFTDYNISSKLTRISNKLELLDFIKRTDFDIFISNGCPYILPIKDLPHKKYINIHPSLLPDLKGYDPVIGAILFGRNSGATCHIMDEGIDTGDIIAQICIPNTEDLDVTTLYQLSFRAEADVFLKAYHLNFVPQRCQEKNSNIITYKRNEKDMFIDFSEPNDLILRKIKAFNNKKIGCSFIYNNNIYKVYNMSLMHNPYLTEISSTYNDGIVIFSYEDNIIFRKDGDIVRFSGIDFINLPIIPTNSKLF